MLYSVWLNMLLVFPLLPLRAQQTKSPTGAAALAAPPNAAPPSVLQITMSNFNLTVESHEVVFVNFYADWCHFSGRLAPIFDEAAVRLAEALPQDSGVCLARVDCVREVDLSNMCGIKKFPTLRLYYRGQPLRQEYRGQRSVEALVAYVQQQLRLSLKYLDNVQELDMIDNKKRTVIGFFASRKNPDAGIYELLAERYKTDCDFYVRIGDRLDNITYTHRMPTIVFRPDLGRTHAMQELFAGNTAAQPELEEWLFKKCVPLVREVDFNNVEEIIEQRLPLLVLFYAPNDVASVKDFKSIVEMQLAGCADCGRFNFVTVDGLKFQHSVQHMGKTARDLPLIAIDSLKFMYPYPKFKDMYIPGHLKQFIQHFSNHQLQPKLIVQNASKQEMRQHPLSTFKDLGPSKHRYTLVGHDEL